MKISASNFNKGLVSMIFTLLVLSLFHFSDGTGRGVVPDKDILLGDDFANQQSTSQKTKYKLISVIDGDTIRVISNGKKIKVRLLGINAPETGSPGSYRKRECFGVEASSYLKKIISDNDVVILQTDSTQSKYDKYGRLLAYVYLPNEIEVGEKMIKDGYAYEYTYRHAYKKQKTYKQAEVYARQHNLGLWAPEACKNF